jgi:hypothetical protein
VQLSEEVVAELAAERGQLAAGAGELDVRVEVEAVEV